MPPDTCPEFFNHVARQSWPEWCFFPGRETFERCGDEVILHKIQSIKSEGRELIQDRAPRNGIGSGKIQSKAESQSVATKSSVSPKFKTFRALYRCGSGSSPPEQVPPLTLSSLPVMSPTPDPPVHWKLPRRLFRVSLCSLRLNLRGSAAGASFSRLMLVVHSFCNLKVRLHACSPPRLAATPLALSSVLNHLTAPAGLSPALMPSFTGAPRFTD